MQFPRAKSKKSETNNRVARSLSRLSKLKDLWLSIFVVAVIIIIILKDLKPTSRKLQAEILTLNKVHGCNDVSFSDHSVLEGDRIPPLKSHGQALVEELCFPGVLSVLIIIIIIIIIIIANLYLGDARF